MAFHNVRLPVDVERGAVGGPQFKTTVLTLNSGKEKRNIDWARARGIWDISYGMDTKANHEAVVAFFYARRGRGHSFRFKDWTDFEIGVDATDTEQEIGIGDAVVTKFQAVRRYTSSVNFDREVTRLVASNPTPRVFVNNVEQTITTHYTIDVETGIITFVTAPPDTESVGLIAEFDVPVRFEQDNLQLSADRDDLFNVQAINIIELKETLGSLA